MVDIVIASDAYLVLVLVLEYSFEVLVLEHTGLVAMWTFLKIYALCITISDPALDGDFLLLLLILRLSSLELSK